MIAQASDDVVSCDCAICSDTIERASDDVASCGSCSQPFHLECLRTALSVDSRCPLCREDVATVGYRCRSSTGIVHPESRRLFGNLEEMVASYENQLERMTWAREFLADMGNISNSMVQLLRRVQKMMDTARRKKGNILREARVLLADITEVGQKADALRARYEDRTGLPDAFNHSADSIFQRLDPLIQSLTSTVQRYSSLAKSKLDAVEAYERSTSESSQQPTSAQTNALNGPRVAAKKICRRPAAHVLSVRRRPAAAISDSMRSSRSLPGTVAKIKKRPKQKALRKVATARKCLRQKERSVNATARKVRNR